MPPPIDYPHSPSPYYSYAVAGTNILYWGVNNPAVLRFDTSLPGEGWTEMNLDVEDTFPVVARETKLFVKLDDGHGFLMFSDEPKYFTPNLQVFVLSPDSDYLNPVEHVPPRLPRALEPGGSYQEHRLFHIDGQKFGLASVRARSRTDERVEVAVTTFEYQVKVAEESLDFKCKVLSTCFLDFYPSIVNKSLRICRTCTVGWGICALTSYIFLICFLSANDRDYLFLLSIQIPC